MTDSPIQITEIGQQNYTILPNDFIDGAMCDADGEYVKIYLMILRLTGSGLPVTPDILADRLNLTQKDILRAVTYWEKAGLLKPLTVRKDNPEVVCEMSERNSGSEEEKPAFDIPDAADSSEEKAIPEKRPLSPLEIEQYQKESSFKRTIFMAETYLGRPFSHNELNVLCYISTQLGFSSDLMEYLVEYCVGKGKKSMRYIERVAMEWYRKGITTVAKAKEESDRYVNHVFPIMKALGLSGRGPAPVELEYIRHWTELGLPSDLIIEACNRTLLTVHQPSFPYVNSIIEDWHSKGVLSMKDVDELDRKHQENRSQKAAAGKAGRPRSNSSDKKNSFHNFDQRSYNYEELEKLLLSRKRREV